MVDLARVNGETLYRHHKNGNPVDAAGREIPVWDFEPPALRRFVEGCFEDGVTFVAVEWGLPDLAVLKEFDELQLVTVVRDPWRRFASNYAYSLAFGYSELVDPVTYLHSCPALDVTDYPLGYCHENYYCRLLARRPHGECEVVTAADLAIALARVPEFDVVMYLESDEIFAPMRKLSWTAVSKHVNKRRPSVSVYAKDTAKLRLRKVTRMLRNRTPSLPADFQSYFEERNWADRQIYEAFTARCALLGAIRCTS